MAKTIEEIFKSKPELLETNEVKELIDQFKEQFNNIKKQKHQYWDEVTDILMRTEFYVKDGLSCEQAIELLIKKSF